MNGYAPVRQKAIDPALKAAAEGELGAEDLVLAEDEEEDAHADAKVGEGSGVGVSCGCADGHDTLGQLSRAA